MEHLGEIFMVVSISLGIPTIILGYVLGKRFLRIVERREDTRQQELSITEKRIGLEERERELEIYKLELEIRQLERGEGLENKQIR